MEDYSPQDLRNWIQELFDPNTSKEDLERNAMTLAHIRQLEALRALEEFQKSSRGSEVEWIECAIEECVFNLLSPENEREEKDYIRVEIWQQYEDELMEMEGRRDAAQERKKRLEVEKEFLESVLQQAPQGEAGLAVKDQLSGIDHLIVMEESKVHDLDLKIVGQEFLVEQIEKAIESPFYRKYGKKHIGVDIHRVSEDWMDEDEDDEIPF